MDYLAHPDVEKFISSVDEVLNSYTLLLNFHSQERTLLLTELSNFIHEGELKKQFLAQHLLRRGINQQRETEEERMEGLVKPDIEIRSQKIIGQGKTDYLKSLLTAENSLRFVQSPYNTQLPEAVADEIMNNFLKALMEDYTWAFYVLEPDFLRTKEEERAAKREGKNIMGYFYELFGDMALLLVRADGEAFLLLTNGSD